MISRKIFLFALALALAAAAMLLTCERTPDFCGTGELYDPDCQFCFGSRAHNMCAGKKYNPLVEGCDPNDAVGTRCQDASAVPKGTPCGGYILTTAVTPQDGGSVSRNPDKSNYEAGDQPTLIAIPEAGYTFVGWAGAHTSAKNEVAEVKMNGINANKPIVAMFKPIDKDDAKRTLTATAFPEYGGDVSASPAMDKYDIGAEVAVTAKAKPGYTFAGWQGDVASAMSENPTITLAMNNSKTLVAMFTSVVHTIKAKTNPEAGGAVFVNGTALAGNTSRDVGASVVVWAKEAEGYIFTGWSGSASADAAGKSNPATITVTDAGTTITANFQKGGGATGGTATESQPLTYTLTVGKNPEGGSVSLNPDATNYGVGTPVTATATPKEGYKFIGWSGAAEGATTRTVLIMMDEDKTLEANFGKLAVVTPTLYVATVSSICNDAAGSGSYEAGKSVDIKAGTPPTGYTFRSWTTNDGVTFTDADSPSTSFIMPKNAVTVTANFNPPADIDSSNILYTVTLSSAGAGATGGGGYKEGETVNISAGTAPANMRFKSWTVISGGVTLANANSAATAFKMPANAVTVRADFEPNTYRVTIVTGTGSNSGDYYAGEQVSISAGTAPTGQQFKNWTSPDGVTFADEYSARTAFTMPERAVTVTANFEEYTIIPTYTLTTSANPAEGGTVTRNLNQDDYDAGTNVTVTAHAASGYTFTGWSGASASANASVTVRMSGNLTLTANFEVIPTYSVTVSSAGTGATGGGDYLAGATVSISAGTVLTGQRFANWTSTPSGVVFADENSLSTSFTMPANAVTVTANFEAIPISTYTVTVEGGTGGGSYAVGATVNITAGAAPAGQQFKNWTSTSSGVVFADANSPSTSFPMLASAVTVTVNFEAIPISAYAVTVSSAGTNHSGTGSYAEGATVTISAGTPPDGYNFKNWISTPSGVVFADANSSPTSFPMPANAVTVIAVFEVIKYTVTVSGGTGATGADSYAVGDVVNISAGTPPTGQQFKNWIGTVSFANKNNATTSFIMPANEVTVTAYFINSNIQLGTLSDVRDGQTYMTVKIGEQTWMAENLNYQTEDSWCYNGSADSCAKYGRLYTWDAAKTACPAGWHLSTGQEWNDLGHSTVTELRATSGWHYSGTDDYGFSALPGGHRRTGGYFDSAGDFGGWWAATEISDGYAYSRSMSSSHYNYVGNGYDDKSYGFSVRCLAD